MNVVPVEARYDIDNVCFDERIPAAETGKELRKLVLGRDLADEAKDGGLLVWL
jgi:hypothetical protein